MDFLRLLLDERNLYASLEFNQKLVQMVLHIAQFNYVDVVRILKTKKKEREREREIEIDIAKCGAEIAKRYFMCFNEIFSGFPPTHINQHVFGSRA